ncbi:hypothetical protein FDC22_00740 [Clostridium botulinum]|uniref:Transposase n=1 Tax=Clostridium botulinum (strain Okra / Type B1) TaxID=498213 RepID=B1IFR3_CLOBK|nr:hypothetical protein [Clostridium botulinum]ACA44666.1 hypothetical protein CLD_2552 [Clostridium botulinum B1 str. Okra]EKX79598.1 hypothetical protein CFSAN001628_011868 [Clostridium botulinum CFSAN001628]MBD5562984.1 hypothetical protein [Clostridium botulinum]MBD5566485.1 hypothetical protein [Clostridium botulinum]MBD5568999.1 hypothetical protein [Clostridium botulinum]
MKSYEQAEDNLFYGDWKNKYNRKNQRWNWGKFATTLLNDYDKVLSVLFAKKVSSTKIMLMNVNGRNKRMKQKQEFQNQMLIG